MTIRAVVAELFDADRKKERKKERERDGRTARHGEAKNCLSQFLESA
jgi:hypothetical protein